MYIVVYKSNQLYVKVILKLIQNEYVSLSEPNGGTIVVVNAFSDHKTVRDEPGTGSKESNRTGSVSGRDPESFNF